MDSTDSNGVANFSLEFFRAITMGCQKSSYTSILLYRCTSNTARKASAKWFSIPMGHTTHTEDDPITPISDNAINL